MQLKTFEEFQALAISRYRERVRQQIEGSPTIVIGRPTNTVFGAAFCLLGAIFLALVIFSIGKGEAHGNYFVAVLVPTVFIFSGFGMATSRNDLTVDVMAQTWTRRKGFLPFAKEWKGSIGDFAAVNVAREMRSSGGRSGLKCEYWVATVSFVDATIPPIVVDLLLVPTQMVDELIIGEMASMLANRLGLPVRGLMPRF